MIRIPEELLPGLVLVIGMLSHMAAGAENGEGDSPFFRIGVNTIDGGQTTLAAWRGKVILIVNVASKCGFTPQYEGLEKLYQQYKDRGLVILGFPSNDFLGQEPGTDEEIKQFCTLTYGVSFPLFSKITVKGKDMHPLYAYLTSKKTNPKFAGSISWNFNKFLIGRDGVVAGRFGSRTKPEDKRLVEALETALEPSH